MSQKKIFIALCAAALAAGFFWIRLRARGPLSAAAPAFELADTAGQTVSLSQFKGRPVLVNFWATWCPACREEIPALESVYQRYRGAGFTILGVSVDEGGKTAVLPFLAGSPITYPVLLCDPETADAYHVYELPDSFLIGPDGKIARHYVGPIDPTDLENDILKLMSKASGKKT
ncbi:MAG: TlpA family protein disulfide reductase [Elusimicrobia bacterium]|nr:TlpA family protein disulfide reductase [Elusimicrobiota bacterium]MDE2314561.1 TlpA family protein disulfide reductase [Elusimicrobiota bacterium]